MWQQKNFMRSCRHSHCNENRTALGKIMVLIPIIGYTLLLFLAMVPPVQMDTVECTSVQTDTSSGTLEGCEIHVPSRSTTVRQYLGVPYAEPPIGKLRFERPEPKHRSENVLIAKSFGPMCPQNPSWLDSNDFNFNVGEDCLVLNIYVPKVASVNTPVDVMVYIHGGSYLDGTGSFYEGKHLAAVGKLVVITLNYRLGLLGFLSSEESGLTGNYGLWDQLLALKWVQSNVGKFGGDPNRVTLFGNSAGSSSVALLSMSPKSKGLFRRIITQSGSPLSPWALVRRPRVFALKLLQSVQCSRDTEVHDFPQLLACLRNLTAEEILGLQHNGHKEWVYAEGTLVWAPWIDGELLVHDPLDLIQNDGLHETEIAQRFGKFDQLIGVTSQEAAFVYETKMKHQGSDNVNGLQYGEYQKLLREISSAIVPPQYTGLLDSILEYSYTDFNQPTDSTSRAEQYINIYSDYAIYSGALTFAKFHDIMSTSTLNVENKGKTYFYTFDHRGSWESREVWRVGGTHQDELPFLFGYKVLYDKGTKEEHSLADVLMILWSNFAKTGDPNIGDDAGLPTDWPRYTVKSQKYLRLVTNYTTEKIIGENLFLPRDMFWSQYVPKMKASIPVSTCSCTSCSTGTTVSSASLKSTYSLVLLTNIIIFCSFSPCLRRN